MTDPEKLPLEELTRTEKSLLSWALTLAREAVEATEAGAATEAERVRELRAQFGDAYASYTPEQISTLLRKIGP